MKNIRPVRQAVSHNPLNANVAAEERSEEYPELGTRDLSPFKSLPFFYLKTIMRKRKPTHGGPRKGAGRPAKEETIVMRVPLSLVPKVLKLIGDRKKTP